MRLSPGDRIDRYEVLELLGAGGMGEVYRARDPKLARLVALKILHIDNMTGTDGPARLLREARAAAALTHANVLAIYDVGEVHEPEALRGLPYIAMELVVGRTLRGYVGDESVPMEKRVEWLREVARALGAAHAAGLVHRDVKPENVMIRDDGAVKVLDFGIARRSAALVQDAAVTPNATTESASLPTLTGPGQIVGTPFFMAPEQLRGEELDGRTDQFAWGVTAYLLLTGVAPWKGNSSDPIAVVSQILSVDPPRACDVAPRVPVFVARAVQRALAKRPDQRFDSMGDLLASLRAMSGPAATTHEPPVRVSTERVVAAPHTASWPRLGRLATILASALILMAAGVTGAGIWRARSARPAVVDGRGASAPAPGSCFSNRQCVAEHGGEPWHCHSQRHVCVELASPDCKVDAEPHDAEADDVVWIGTSFSITTFPIDSEFNAARLARQDFAKNLSVGGSPPGPFHARPIGLVVCDEGVDASRAMRHLVDDVESPAVIGFLSVPDSLKTISTVLLPHNVLSFVTLSQAPVLTRIPEPPTEPRLIWRSTLDHDDIARVAARFIGEVLEPARRADGHAGSRPLKVAALWPQGVEHEMVETLFRELHFNGLSALDNGTNFRQFVYEAEAPGPSPVVADLVRFAPDFIVFADQDVFPKVILPLESRWGSSPRPVYITGSGLGPDETTFAGNNEERRRRFFAVTNATTTIPNAQLVLRYNLAFPIDPIIRTEAPQPTYDAFYVLAYAVYASNASNLTGSDLARALVRLEPPGSLVEVGPRDIPAAFQTLRLGGKIDLEGAIGSLDFDPGTGESPIDYAIVCLGVDERKTATRTVDSGLVFDARAGKFVGTLHCP